MVFVLVWAKGNNYCREMLETITMRATRERITIVEVNSVRNNSSMILSIVLKKKRRKKLSTI